MPRQLLGNLGRRVQRKNSGLFGAVDDPRRRSADAGELGKATLGLRLLGALVTDVLPGAYHYHFDFEKIKWDEVIWELEQKVFSPDMEKSLVENGVGHKSVLCFTSPGLKGINGASI